MKKAFDQFQAPDFYIRRYFISQFMSWTDVHFIRDGTKVKNWKNAISTKIRISPENNKNIEIQGDKIYQGITDLKEETTNDDAKTRYLLLYFQKDCFAITCRPELLDQITAALSFVLELKVDKPIVVEKLASFENLIAESKRILAQNVEQEAPAVPNLPNMASVEKLYPPNPC